MQPLMKADPALLLALLLALPLAAPAPAGAARAEPLQQFTETGGCKVHGSPSSVRRMQEISTQGSVTWDGACVGGYIDGSGVLRHQGATLENGRQRRYAFYLTGTARKGRRDGAWQRESFNMFTDSTKYWTSLARIEYVDGVAKRTITMPNPQANTGFTAPFRKYLSAIDSELAATTRQPIPEPIRKPEAGTVAAAAAPSPAQTPAPAAAPIPAPAPAPATASAPSPASAPAATAAPTLAAATPASPQAAAPPSVQQQSAPEIARPAASPSTPRTASIAPGSGAASAPHPGLRQLAPPGTPLPAPAPPALPQQQILEQHDACSIDQINGRAIGEDAIVAAAAQPLRVAGWAADPRRPRPPEPPRIPEQAWIRFFNRGGGAGLLVEMPRNAERPDVARSLGHPGYARAGFRITVEPGRLRAGDYTVAIVQRFGVDLAVCSTIGRLNLR